MQTATVNDGLHLLQHKLKLIWKANIWFMNFLEILIINLRIIISFIKQILMNKIYNYTLMYASNLNFRFCWIVLKTHSLRGRLFNFIFITNYNNWIRPIPLIVIENTDPKIFYPKKWTCHLSSLFKDLSKIVERLRI